MSITTSRFGTTKDGAEVTQYTITNKQGVSVSALDYGAVIVSLMTPDKNGKLSDIVLGFDDVAGYEVNGCFFGAFIGRHGNRIGQARFTLNGVTYQLEKNDGENNLHGGTPGYHQVMYQASTTDNSVTFSRLSPDMEQGYPGNLEIAMTYTLTDENELKIEYETKSDKDTLCNLTNHSYFNLKGHDGGSITDHKVWIKANGFTGTSDDLIPDGSIVDVTGTPMDFRTEKAISQDIEADYQPLILAGGYDHNYVLDKPEGKMEKVAEVSEDTSGRRMEVYTDLPGMQLYSGNFIEKEDGKGGVQYTKRTGLCLETQFFPNSVNVPSFTSCVLKAGETFRSTTVYKFI
ncbi:MAG: galactose mutarotase [Lachnospiraceae bacterium]|nr:galactose mutarotase [Lachnospiraceae bacterium]